MASFEDFIYRIPGIGPLTGAEPDAMKDLRRQTDIARQRTADQAQKSTAGRMQGLSQITGMMAPYNQAMADIFGPQYQIPVAQLSQNPMPGPSQQQIRQQQLAQARNATKIKPEI